MTNTKTLELLTAAYKTLTADERKNADFIIDHNIDDENSALISTTGAYIGVMILQARAAIYEDEAKKTGGNKLLSAAKRILKEAAKSPKEILHYAHRDGDFTYICDGFRILKTPVRFESLEAPAHITGEYINCENAIGRTNEHEENLLTVPSAAELKAHIKTEKATHKGEKGFKVFYDFGENLPAVNAEYLLDMVEAIPDGKFYKGNSETEIIYITNGNGTEGAICPIRKESIKKTA